MTRTERALVAAQAAAARPPLGQKRRTQETLRRATTRALALHVRRCRGRNKRCA